MVSEKKFRKDEKKVKKREEDSRKEMIKKVCKGDKNCIDEQHKLEEKLRIKIQKDIFKYSDTDYRKELQHKLEDLKKRIEENRILESTQYVLDGKRFDINELIKEVKNRFNVKTDYVDEHVYYDGTIKKMEMDLINTESKGSKNKLVSFSKKIKEIIGKCDNYQQNLEEVTQNIIDIDLHQSISFLLSQPYESMQSKPINIIDLNSPMDTPISFNELFDMLKILHEYYSIKINYYSDWYEKKPNKIKHKIRWTGNISDLISTFIFLHIIGDVDFLKENKNDKNGENYEDYDKKNAKEQAAKEQIENWTSYLNEDGISIPGFSWVHLYSNILEITESEEKLIHDTRLSSFYAGTGKKKIHKRVLALLEIYKNTKQK